MTDLELSQAIEDVLVARNLRNMRAAQAALTPGYYLRAANYLKGISGAVIIGTGFPVDDTFETDGPVGAIALYDTLKALGADPWLACAPPLSVALAQDYQVLELRAPDLAAAKIEAAENIAALKPAAIISIERPGLTEDGCYYNMRGENITARCGFFDPYMQAAGCPTIAIGDGGNEIGMGNIAREISELDINVAVTRCDELLVADVSNWGAYGLISFLGLWAGSDLLAALSPPAILDYLSKKGSVDGVTRKNTTTEDGLPASEGYSVIEELQQLTASRSSHSPD
ncbi:MAG: DUF4392 domain-containing protein [Proteobacteria bacterium]|nr:DUF4392 domain-containing protein [Pseudomonadota bacterium]